MTPNIAIKIQQLYTNIRLAFWNADGLRTKKNELEEFSKRNEIDIITVNETHLVPGWTVKIPNYNQYRADRLSDEGGGTAIYIKQSLDHSDLGPEDNLKKLEANSIIVNLDNNTKIKITSVYGPPTNKLLTDDLDTIFNCTYPTNAVGDFNSKQVNWNSTATNNRGKVLLKYPTDNNLMVHSPDAPTYYPKFPNRPPD